MSASLGSHDRSPGDSGEVVVSSPVLWVHPHLCSGYNTSSLAEGVTHINYMMPHQTHSICSINGSYICSVFLNSINNKKTSEVSS